MIGLLSFQIGAVVVVLLLYRTVKGEKTGGTIFAIARWALFLTNELKFGVTNNSSPFFTDNQLGYFNISVALLNRMQGYTTGNLMLNFLTLH